MRFIERYFNVLPEMLKPFLKTFISDGEIDKFLSLLFNDMFDHLKIIQLVLLVLNSQPKKSEKIEKIQEECMGYI